MKLQRGGLSRNRASPPRISHDRAAARCGADHRVPARRARLGRPVGRFSRPARGRRPVSACSSIPGAGYGQSSPSAMPRRVTFMHEEAREVLPRVLDAIGFRRGVLLGHSDGASIAAILRAVPRTAPLRHRAAGTAFLRGSLWYRGNRTGKGTLRGRRLPRQSSRAGTAIPTTPSTAGAAPGSIRSSSTGTSGPSLPPSAYRCCVVQGDQDQYGTLEQVEMAKRLARAPSRR